MDVCLAGHHEITSSSALGDKLPTPGTSPPLSSNSGSPRLPPGASASPTTTIHYPGAPGAPQYIPHYDFSNQALEIHPVQWTPWPDQRYQPPDQRVQLPDQRLQLPDQRVQLPQFQQMYSRHSPYHQGQLQEPQPYPIYEHVKTEYPYEEQDLQIQPLNHQNPNFVPTSEQFHPNLNFADSSSSSHFTPDLHSSQQQQQFLNSSGEEVFVKDWEQQGIKHDVEELQDMNDFLEFNSPKSTPQPTSASDNPQEFFWQEQEAVVVSQDLENVEFDENFPENLTEL